MHLGHYLGFASDATITAWAGGVLLALSALAMWRERRRQQRSDPDAVGLVPWRDVAALACFGGLVLVAMAVVGWVRG